MALITRCRQTSLPAGQEQELQSAQGYQLSFVSLVGAMDILNLTILVGFQTEEAY